MTEPGEPLRLLYFAGKSFPGAMAVRMHTELLDHLAAYAIETIVVARGPLDQPSSLVTTVEAGRRVIRFGGATSLSDRALNAASKWLLHYDFFLSGVRRLAGIIARERFDVLQAQMAYPYGAMAALALALSRHPAGLVINLAGGDLIASEEARYGYARFASVRRLLRFAFQRAIVVRANSPVMAERAVALGCPPDRLRVVPSNVTTVVWPPAPLADFRRRSRERLLAAHQLPDGPLLLAVGRLSPIKGFHVLVRALPALVARWPTLTLLIVGPTVTGEEAYAARLQANAETLGVGAHLRLLGPAPLEAMRDLYAAADLLLVTSLFEGLNKTGIEAGASGTPCIATASTGLAHYVATSGAGRVVPPEDPAALAEAAHALLAEPGQWAACAEAARQMAEQFLPSAIARALLPLYAAAAPANHPWQVRVRSHLKPVAPAPIAVEPG